jgi:regulator of nonsense transcripts 2
MMVENAYYQANPPDKSAIQVKERPPMELYIRKLIHEDLCKKSLDKILKQLRKLHWEDASIRALMAKIFQKIWKIKFGNIHLLAILASGLNRYHTDFGVQVVDGVIEEIRIGLELNIFKHNQRRIAVAKYLGELYNYRMIESPLIFDTLYSIVTFGHEFGRPARERFCSIDAPNDFFRIRLVCTLLDTCGMCFDRGSSKKKLDNFLTFFQVSFYISIYFHFYS